MQKCPSGDFQHTSLRFVSPQYSTLARKGSKSINMFKMLVKCFTSKIWVQIGISIVFKFLVFLVNTNILCASFVTFFKLRSLKEVFQNE